MRVARVLITIAFAVFFFFNPDFKATAHPGGTAADGCHYCNTNCEQWGVPYNERHCHGGSTDTTSPPATEPPTTSPPATTPPSTSAPSPGGSTGTTKPRTAATTSTTTTTTSAPAELPAPEMSVSAPTETEPELVVAIEGEPGASYEVSVASTPQSRTGALDASGQAEERFLVENGEHTVTVTLAGADGARSEAIEETVSVDLTAPGQPTVDFVTEDGEARVAVEDAPPFGRVTVSDDDGSKWSARVEDDGTATVVLDGIESGDHDLTVVAVDHQDREAEPVLLLGVEIGEDDSATVGETIGGLLLLVGIAGGTYWWLRRRRTRKERPAQPAQPVEPAQSAVASPGTATAPRTADDDQTGTITG